MNKKLSFLLMVVLSYSGCTTAPLYEKPVAPIPQTWPEGEAYEANSASANVSPAVDIHWTNVFRDERLKTVIEMAVNNNRDLQVAALTVQRAQAMYGIQRAELFPTLDLTGSGTKGRISGSSFGGGGGIDIEQYSVNLGLSSWEIDFFGRLRNLEESALQEFLATEESRRSVQISLIFQVANAYLALAADRENLQLAQRTYETQTHAYDLIQQRRQVGLSNELDLQRAQTQVDAARVDISRYTQRVAQDINALTLLVGSTTPLTEELLPSSLDNVVAPQSLTPGLPSETLLRRPDILSAELRLKGAYANIRAARAAFFPRISLTSSLGTASGDLADLFSSGTETWNFAPQIVMPIFDSRLRAAYKVSETDKEIAVILYGKAIQNAFREVADALAVQGTVDTQILAQQSLVESAAKSHELSTQRYKAGIDNYLGVLEAQRSQYAAEQQLVMLRLAKFVNQARLYAVLGGGAPQE